MAVELHPHQLEAVRNMHNGCILKGDVGTGKSITAIAYYYLKVTGAVPRLKGMQKTEMKRPMDMYVITTAKKRNKLEWEDDASHFGLFRESNEDGVQMHVDSWNNITDYEDVTDAFFIFDEQRLVGNGTWVQAFYKIAKNNKWVILSATPGDTWMDYIPVFVANGFYKNRSAFIEQHVIYGQFSKFPKPRGYMGTKRLEANRAAVLVEMPFERHTIRHVEHILTSYDKGLYDKVAKDRWHIYEERPAKDVAEIIALARKVVNTDASRLGEMMKLVEKHPRLIIFYNFNYELELLRTLGKTLDIPLREWNGHKHEEIPDTDKWIYLVQYTAGAEGWNCITTDAIAFWSLNYSWKALQQSKGRIDRLNTPFTDLYYYILRSGAPIDQAIWKAQTTKQVFNEKRYAIETGWLDDEYQAA